MPQTASDGENNDGQTLNPAHRHSVIVYDLAQPFIIVGALDPSGDDMRIEPDVDSHPRLVRLLSSNYGQRREETSSVDSRRRWVMP